MEPEASTCADSQASHQLVNDFGDLVDCSFGVKGLNIECEASVLADTGHIVVV